jgi:hypothetical protein
VSVDDLDHHLDVLELHLLIVALMGNVLLAFPLAGRRAVVMGMLLSNCKTDLIRGQNFRS